MISIEALTPTLLGPLRSDLSNIFFSKTWHFPIVESRLI